MALHDGPSAGARRLAEKAGASALLHFLGQFAHRFLGDDPFPAGQGGSGIIERQQKFRSLPFPFFPQGKGLLYRVKASATNDRRQKAEFLEKAQELQKQGLELKKQQAAEQAAATAAASPAAQ